MVKLDGPDDGPQHVGNIELVDASNGAVEGRNGDADEGMENEPRNGETAYSGCRKLRRVSSRFIVFDGMESLLLDRGPPRSCCCCCCCCTIRFTISSGSKSSCEQNNSYND